MENIGGKKTVAIIGLGLMGGSMALALKRSGKYTVIAYNRNPLTAQAAMEAGAADILAQSVKEAVENADVSFFCAPPKAVIRVVAENAAYFRRGSIVSEICGVKEDVSREILRVLPRGVDYVGVHPMAGKEEGGFANADAELYKNAGFIVISGGVCPQASADTITGIIRDIGSDRVIRDTPQAHDSIIAYTSDLMHIAAAALTREPAEGMSLIHTAGAFRDCTRIADIDAGLWTELLLLNAGNTTRVLGRYIESLTAVKQALEQGDGEILRGFLQAAGDNKRRIKRLEGDERL